ncbi:Phytanoyl-CoA dioxygenase, partial [Rhizoctonia solani]
MSENSSSVLTPEQVAKFYKDGYLILPGFIPKDETAALLSRAKQLIAEFSLEGHPMTRFTTGEEDDPTQSKKHVGDEYFLASGDKIRFFLEDDAFDAQGNLVKPKEKSVNKIGHGLHELDAVFHKFTMENEKLRQLARDLAFHQDPEVLQSMVICKQPEIGGKVPEHNDSTFLYTDPPSALGFWFALEPCTEFNGALSFLAGSHRSTPINKRFVRLPEGGTGFTNIETPITPLDLQNQPSERSTNTSTAEGDYVLETCDAGTLVLIHGSVLHKSERNTSQNTRFAYTFHMIESAPKARYDERNWLQPTETMPFSKLYGTQAVH